MDDSDSDILRALESRARRARPHGQVVDARQPRRSSDAERMGVDQRTIYEYVERAEWATE